MIRPSLFLSDQISCCIRLMRPFTPGLSDGPLPRRGDARLSSLDFLVFSCSPFPVFGDANAELHSFQWTDYGHSAELFRERSSYCRCLEPLRWGGESGPESREIVEETGKARTALYNCRSRLTGAEAVETPLSVLPADTPSRSVPWYVKGTKTRFRAFSSTDWPAVVAAGGNTSNQHLDCSLA